MDQVAPGHLVSSNIPRTTLTITTWAFFIATTILLVSRLIIRVWLFRQLFWDDVLAIAAFLFLVGQVAAIAVIAPTVYQLIDASRPMRQSGEFDDQLTFAIRGTFGHSLCFTICVYLVKASFMSFFWRLVRSVDAFRRLWWAVAVLCGLSFCVTMALFPASCTKYHAHGCDSELDIWRDLITLRFGTAMDIITDAFIMGLPISFVLKSHLPPVQKLCLILLFALGFSIIGICILRIITLNNDSKHPSTSWLLFWGTLESCIAVMTSCFATFKSLFSAYKHSSGNPQRSGRRFTSSNASRKYGDLDISVTERMTANTIYSSTATANHEMTTVVTSAGPDALIWADDDSREDIVQKTVFEVRFESASNLMPTDPLNQSSVK